MADPIFILGIHDGHNCGATLTQDGRILASISEERLSRRKNDVGYPRRAIEAVLRIGDLEPRRLDAIVYASNFMHSKAHLEDIAAWYPIGIEEQRAAERRPKDYARQVFEQRRKERIAEASAHLGLPAERVHFVEHHLAHLAAAYFTAPASVSGPSVLGLTCDGAGDGLAATVSICRGSRIERIAETDRHASLGKIYSRVTFLLGMTPWEHEYKIMGLAPYADPERGDRAAEPLRRLLRLSANGLAFERAGELSTNYSYRYLRDSFERVRFDTIAGAIQRFTEEMLVSWVRACVRETGLRDIVAGGGVFMNVKANMLLAQMPEVRSLYVMPSASDESLSIGACLHHYYAMRPDADHGESALESLYLGDSYAPAAEDAAIAGARREMDLSVSRPKDMNAAVAELLAAGDVVAVCRGRMEWGARALGNRSIVSTAHDYRRVDEINRMIKMRDFWMPFAPSIAAEHAGRYLDGPDSIRPQFMTFAMPARRSAFADLTAAAHPRDGTVRPQVVSAAANPDYHAVLIRFSSLTGRGVVLNTSFNLHGEPIVNDAGDALRVLKLSGLRHLALDRHLVSKAKDGS